MSSPAVLALDLVVATWEALTAPTDGTSLPYRELEDAGSLRRDGSGHRLFAFGAPSWEPIREAGVESTDVAWTLPVEVFLSAAHHTTRALIDAALNEIALLARAIDKLPSSSLPSGVGLLSVESATTELVEGGAVLRLELRLETTEED